MTLTVSVPDRYAYVVLTGAATGWLTLWQSYLSVTSRTRAQIPFPQVYAEKAEAEKSIDALKFNCTQRAHQNTLETLPPFLFILAMSGLRYPTLSAGLGATWLFGRVLYTLGYMTGDPNKRYRGAFSNWAALGLLLTATWSAGELVYTTL